METSIILKGVNYTGRFTVEQKTYTRTRTCDHYYDYDEKVTYFTGQGEIQKGRCRKKAFTYRTQRTLAENNPTKLEDFLVDRLHSRTHLTEPNGITELALEKIYQQVKESKDIVPNVFIYKISNSELLEHKLAIELDKDGQHKLPLDE